MPVSSRATSSNG